MKRWRRRPGLFQVLTKDISMNANSLDQIRAASGSRDGRDDRMEQVRQLLVGDHVRDMGKDNCRGGFFERHGGVASR